MVKRLKLNEKTLREAEPKPGVSYQIFDTEVIGFAARVQASGARTFTIDYRYAGRQRRMDKWAISRAERERRAAAAANRSAARALVDRAAAAVDLRPDLSMRSNVVRLMSEMYRLDGSLYWHRGWVDRLRGVLSDAGCAVPSPKVVRWYRSRLSDDPMYFARTLLVDVETLEAIERKYLRL